MYTSKIVLLAVLCIIEMSGAQIIQSSEKKVSIFIRRNLTGHWLTQLSLRHDADQNDVHNGLAVDVSQNTTASGSKSTLETSISLTGPPARAGPGYELFPSFGYYKFHTVTKKWAEARDVCISEGSHLVIPNSEGEVSILIRLFGRHPKINDAAWNDWAWIGIHEDGLDRTYVTVLGQPFNETGFSRWYPSQGEDRTNDDGLVINRVTGALGDSRSGNKGAFICEQELW